MRGFLEAYCEKSIQAAPLAVFRILFGLMMFAGIVRFWAYGWIEARYLDPALHFTYYGFEWVQPLGNWTYLLFVLCGASALMIALGWKYRLASVLFFLSFTYIELMDKTTYLNHYYFISLVAFLMIFLPANAYFSLDARSEKYRFQRVPAWTVDSIKLLLALVYIHAGLAKINSDWLLEAMPLKIWLPARTGMPLIGGLMGKEWVHYAFSWAGMLYDLSIPFLLLWRPSRWLALALVVVFHTLTAVLFPIGLFPYVMIVSVLVFFEPRLHHRLLQGLSNVLGIRKSRFDNGREWRPGSVMANRFRMGVLGLFFIWQLLLPWRYLCYPGELFWTEEGFRFSWRVMLMEKTGYAQFKVVENATGKWYYVNNADFLTPFQEKQMGFQPDFILEYARYLKGHFEARGGQEVAVYVDCFVSLNGRPSQRYIDPGVDLGREKESFSHKTWILPFNDEIKGL
ncbi:HTTM domain-containing protein [Robiginitalea sp. SC105]|uniref:HTTM domain-containing protein n=1 Tax=Robiginitalea sp. SC105 TaxID=2762332 RepID=UPI00163B065B|nr:HTTM domain-containing protein [Robiginitalea sp. SC105]MBC2839936.1 HTTM domain-containing protein [Robiginitalea sp. SC105]